MNLIYLNRVEKVKIIDASKNQIVLRLRKSIQELHKVPIKLFSNNQGHQQVLCHIV